MVGKKLTDSLSVSGQILPEQMSDIAQAGFKVVVCNRPDHEEPGQPLTADMAEAASKAGLDFVSIPVVGGAITDQAVQDFSDVLKSSTPVFAYCRTGTRSTFLWSLSQNGQRPAQEILETAAAAGYDMSVLLPRLQP